MIKKIENYRDYIRRLGHMRLLYKNLFDILLWRVDDGINLVASIRAALEARDIMFMKSEFLVREYAISN